MPFIIIGFVLFVAGGDQVFPGGVGKASTQIRTTVNNFLIGVFPTWQPKTKPYDRTEQELQELDRKR
jgi:hypothetical protein